MARRQSAKYRRRALVESPRVALLQRRIAPVSALFSADFREACGELDAVLRYEVETTDHTAV